MYNKYGYYVLVRTTDYRSEAYKGWIVVNLWDYYSNAKAQVKRLSKEFGKINVKIERINY